jgi:hypothetical protein
MVIWLKHLYKLSFSWLFLRQKWGPGYDVILDSSIKVSSMCHETGQFDSFWYFSEHAQLLMPLIYDSWMDYQHWCFRFLPSLAHLWAYVIHVITERPSSSLDYRGTFCNRWSHWPQTLYICTTDRPIFSPIWYLVSPPGAKTENTKKCYNSWTNGWIISKFVSCNKDTWHNIWVFDFTYFSRSQKSKMVPLETYFCIYLHINNTTWTNSI